MLVGFTFSMLLKDMQNIDISLFEDEFVLHYGGAAHSVDAEVFAGSLLEITNIIQEISFLTHPDCVVEVKVEALDKGSFRPKIKLVFKNVLGEVKEYMPEKKATIPTLIALFALLQSCNVEPQTIMNEQQVVLEQNNIAITMERKTYDDAQRLIRNKNIRKSVSNHFEVIDSKPEIENFGIVETTESNEYPLLIPRSEFKGFVGLDEVEIEEELTEKVERNVKLKLLKIVLERGTRKWEFVWNGHKVSAPVLDEQFWDDFERHDIEIGSGDVMQADLRIKRQYDPVAKTYINQDYEVINVRNLDKAYKQKGDLFDKQAANG